VLNDLRTTHGVARTSDKNEVCTTATGTVRHVTAKMKQQVWASYGISAVRRNGKNYEIDHLIPLELGGSNELSNLWPQPYRPQAAACEEDVLENYYRITITGRYARGRWTSERHSRPSPATGSGPGN